jgi:hypothetical protein
MGAASVAPCTPVAPSKGVDTLELYRDSADAREEPKIAARDVRICGLEEQAKDMRYHVHVEWITHTEVGDYWIPASEISGPGGIRPDTPIIRPGTFPAGTLAKAEPGAAAGALMVYLAGHGHASALIGAACCGRPAPDRELGAAFAGYDLATAPVLPGGWMRGAERPLVQQIAFGSESRLAPERINAAIESHGSALPPAAPSAETIKRLQAALKKAGARLVVDGKMGLQTGMALADWQRAHGLRATGRLDPASERLLGLVPEGKREYENAIVPPKP